jgi:hypothetical protein
MPYLRRPKWRGKVFRLASIGWFAVQCLTAQQLGKADPLIQVQLWNRANLSPLVLTSAEAKANRVLEDVGVRVNWVHCYESGECAGPVRPDQLVLELFRTCIGAYPSCNSSPLGFAVAHDAERLPYHAFVFCDEVDFWASRYAIRPALVLGHVIAHEIAHLLIGLQSHDLYGLMKGNWGLKEIMLAAHGRLRLDKSEATRLRQAVIARSSIR